MRAEPELRVFVVGVPRSGTTLLQSLLATHSAVASFTESHLFSRHFRILPIAASPVLMRDPGERLLEFLAENGVEAENVAALLAEAGWTGVGPGPLIRQTRAIAGEILGVLDALCRTSNKPVWVEKTPRHLRYAAYLQRLCGDSGRLRFVHMVREGTEVAASLYLASRTWEEAYDLETCARRWNADVTYSLGRLSSRHDHFVFYEDLTRDPESTMRTLLASLGLEWEPSILTEYRDTSSRLIAAGETWKEGVDGTLAHSRASLSSLTDRQRADLDSWLDRSLYDRIYQRVNARRRPEWTP